MSDLTAAELELEAEAARTRVADTAESLRNKMSPGQLIDEFSGVFRGSDGSMALGNLKNQVRDNPLPLLLVGAGLAWLMLGSGPKTRQHAARTTAMRDDDWAYRSAGMGSALDTDGENWSNTSYEDGGEIGEGAWDETSTRRRSTGRSASQALSDAAGVVSSVAGEVVHGAKAAASGLASAASGVASVASGVAHSAGSAVSGVAHAAGSAASGVSYAAGSAARAAGGVARSAGGLASSAGGALSDAAGGAAHGAGAAGDSVRRMAGGASRSAKDAASRVMDQDPLILAALGLAVGAAIGAMLPQTEVENRNFGPQRDKLKDQAAKLVGEGVETAKAVASDAYETAKTEAADAYQTVRTEGLPEDGSLVDKVVGVVKSAAAHAEETVRDRVGDRSNS